jgi:hypothetical protein
MLLVVALGAGNGLKFFSRPGLPLLKKIERFPNRSAPGCQTDSVRASADVRRAAHFHVAQRRMWP